MSTLSDEDALALLRAALPVAAPPPAADLWPQVRRRIDRGTSPALASDWLLAVAIALLCLLNPSLAGILLLHF